MQLPGGSINPFLPGHLDGSRPEFNGYAGFPAAIISPLFEARSCFFKADGRGFSSWHSLPSLRLSRRKTDLTSQEGWSSCRLTERTPKWRAPLVGLERDFVC